MESEVHSNSSDLYDEVYFERGVQAQKSGYQNYSWLPELTMKMAHHLIQELPMSETDVALDFGCAKGFLVKALRLLEIEAYGVDVSEYAIRNSDPTVKNLCKLVSGVSDPQCFQRSYDWLIAKDVFEHLTEPELVELLQASKENVGHMFAAIPLGKKDGSGFLIPEYDRDVTHVTKKPVGWWENLFQNNGWRITALEYQFPGVKQNWTSHWHDGNAFFVVANDN